MSDEKHEQMTETRSWSEYDDDGNVTADHTTSRAICGTCYREQFGRRGHLEYVSVDWPCEVVRLRERVAALEAEVSRLRFGGSSLAEVYQCAACSACACQGFDDGLPADWQQNTDGDAFCAACLAKRPLDPHECEDEMCCAALAGQEPAGEAS